MVDTVGETIMIDGRTVRLPTPEDIKYVRENPENLTKEGIELSHELWRGRNRYVELKFRLMKEGQCDKVKPSKKVTDNKGKTRVVYGYDSEGVPNWLSDPVEEKVVPKDIKKK